MEKGTKLLEGSIWKGVVAFAIPLFLGNLFQQLYNTVDSLIHHDILKPLLIIIQDLTVILE